jgi:succinate-semialdehyde dehydrogenase/glutarate-semialdehyde dehydrogenase
MAVALKDIRNTLKDPSLFIERCYIDGEWVLADSGKSIEVTDPATGETLGTVPGMGVEETRRAIAAAEAALPAWRAKTAKERSAVLRKWFDLIIENKDDLAYLMTLEQGKPLAEAGGEVVYGASFVEWFAEEGKRVYGDVIPQNDRLAAHPCDQAAGRRLRRDQPWKLPECDDSPGNARPASPWAAPSSSSRPR